MLYTTSYLLPIIKETGVFALNIINLKRPKGQYKVFIDSTLKNIGNLVYSDSVIPGKSKNRFASSYLCHPQMANHELGGPIVLSFLYSALPKIQVTQLFLQIFNLSRKYWL